MHKFFRARNRIRKIILMIALSIAMGSSAIAKQLPKSERKEKSTPFLSKEKIPLSKQELANLYYFRSVKLLETGKDVKAVEGLQKILENIPHHIQARLKLLEIYSDIGWDEEAQNLLDEGLRLDKNNSKLIMQKAAMFLNNDNAEKALSLLLKVKPADQASSQYRSILAMTYFDLKLYELARKNYSYLVRAEIDTSKWWLGLAVTMDAEGDTKGAIKSFKRVKSLGGENATVLHYAQNRILALQKKL